MLYLQGGGMCSVCAVLLVLPAPREPRDWARAKRQMGCLACTVLSYGMEPNIGSEKGDHIYGQKIVARA